MNTLSRATILAAALVLAFPQNCICTNLVLPEPALVGHKPGSRLIKRHFVASLEFWDASLVRSMIAACGTGAVLPACGWVLSGALDGGGKPFAMSNINRSSP